MCGHQRKSNTAERLDKMATSINVMYVIFSIIFRKQNLVVHVHNKYIEGTHW